MVKKCEYDAMVDRVKELEGIINRLAQSPIVGSSVIEYWVEQDQIDPHLLMGNADECYEKGMNGKWVAKGVDYGELDDWVWGYGSQNKKNEYVIHISGGGDPSCPNGFEDWVIKKLPSCELGYYIRHGSGRDDPHYPDRLQKGRKLVSCPDGDYVSFQDKDYTLVNGEMDFEWLEDELDFFGVKEE